MNAPVILILGKRGYGKTTLCKKLIEHLPYSKVIIIDALGYEYNDGEIFYSSAELYERLLELKNEESWKLILRPTNVNDAPLTFKMIRCLKNVLLVCEEATLYIRERKPNEDILWLTMFGRHLNNALILIGRTIPEINIRIRNEITSFYVFKFTEPIYLNLLEQYGFDKNIIQNLSKHEFCCLGNEILDESILEKG